MNKQTLFLCSLLFYSMVCYASMGGQHLSSDREFFEALNLDYPGLKQVMKNSEKGDYSTAKHLFVEYLKKRTKPTWSFDWRDRIKSKQEYLRIANINEADRYANNELLSCGVWYKFGKTIEWTSNHAPDNYAEWTWQLNRFSYWTDMGKAYWATGDEKYAKAFINQLNSWIDQCAEPSSLYNGVGSAWRTIETGIRALGNWPNAFFYFLSSPSLDDESVIKMLKSFYVHGDHLMEHNTAGNWLAIEMQGLFTLGVLFPEFKEADNWRDYAINRLYEEELKQFYPDGAQMELAPGYHALSLSSIVGVYQLAKLNGINLPEGYVQRLEKAYEYFAKIMLPDGTLPAVNDSDWENASLYLRKANELFPGRKDFKYVISSGKEGKKPKYSSVWMPWAGWYIMRTGWQEEDCYSFFDVGPYGTGHQHEDKLSFILYAYGNKLITESGIYAYDGSGWRKYALSARGHNVARIDGKDQNRKALRNEETNNRSIKPLHNKWNTNKEFDYGEGAYTEGYGENLDKTVTHRRSVKFVKNKRYKYWVVTDRFIPSDNNLHKYETWFHFNTDSYGENKEMGIVYSDDATYANIAIIPLGKQHIDIDVVKGQNTPEIQGWVTDVGRNNTFFLRQVATSFYRFRGEGEITQHYLFLPYRSGERMPVKYIKRKTPYKFKVYMNNGEVLTIKLYDSKS